MKKDYFRKNILITGASGYLGQNLLESILQNPDVSGNNFFLLSSEKIKNYNCILHKNHIYKKQSFLDAGLKNIDVLIMLGSFCPKCRNEMNAVKENLSTIETCEHLLENLPSVPKKIIYISTISVYGSLLINNPTKINEKTPVNADFLYGIAKLFSEKILTEYCKENGVECQILRLGVMYGGIGEVLRKGTIPTLIKSVMKGKTIRLYNQGKDLKHFIYIKDCLNIIIKSMNNKTIYPILNVVSTETTSIRNLVELIAKKCNKKLPDFEELERDFQVNDSEFDNKNLIRAFVELNFNLEKGLKETCHLFLKELECENIGCSVYKE